MSQETVRDMAGAFRLLRCTVPARHPWSWLVSITLAACILIALDALGAHLGLSVPVFLPISSSLMIAWVVWVAHTMRDRAPIVDPGLIKLLLAGSLVYVLVLDPLERALF